MLLFSFAFKFKYIGRLRKTHAGVIFGGLLENHLDARKHHELWVDFPVSAVSYVVSLAVEMHQTLDFIGMVRAAGLEPATPSV